MDGDRWRQKSGSLLTIPVPIITSPFNTPMKFTGQYIIVYAAGLMVSFAPRRKASSPFSFPNQNSSTLPRFRAISIEQKDSSPSLFHHSSTMDAHAERFTTDEIASAAFLFHFSFSCTRVKKRCSLIRPSSFLPILKTLLYPSPLSGIY